MRSDGGLQKGFSGVKERTTLRDIADHAGVSLTTVSQTLNNKGAISDVTRTKVRVAAEHLGYQPRAPAAPRFEVRPDILTMLMKRDPDEKAPNPFHYYVMKGVEDQCRQLGLELRFSSLSVDENSRALEVPSAADLRTTDGLLIVGAVVADGPAFLDTLGTCPVVFVNGYLRGAAYDRIGVDNRAGAYDAAAYLLGRGHTHVGFVGGGAGVHPSVTERREGYLTALRDAGVKTSYIADSLILTPDYAAAAAKELLEARPTITALVAASDNVAMGIYRAAERLGLQVPRDLSVVGFDNLHGVEHLSPPLTTMNIDKEYLGAAAVRHLYDTAALPKRPKVSLLVRPDLVERRSVSSPVRQASPQKPSTKRAKGAP